MQSPTPPPSFLTLNTGGSLLQSAIVDPAAGYAYFGSSASPAMIFRVRLSDFTYSANLTLIAAQTGAAAAVMDPTRHTAYIGTYSGQIVKIDLTSFGEIAALSPSLGSIASAAIDPTGGFAYFGTDTTPGNIIKIRLSDFSVNKTINLGSGGGVGSAVIDPVRGYAYFATSGCGINIFHPPPPNEIVRVRLSNFDVNQTQRLTLPSAENCLFSADIDPAGGYAYFASRGLAGGDLVRIRLSDFSMAGVLSPGPANAVSSVALDPARGVAYAGEGSGSFSTIRLSDYNQIGSVFVFSPNGGVFNQDAAALDPATGYSYFTASTFGNNFRDTGVIVRLSPASLPSNDFSLSTSPLSISFQDGGIGAAYINIASSNFTGTVNLTATTSSGYAINPTVAITTPSVDLVRNGENSSILTIFAPIADDVPTSTFTLTVTGTSGGISREASMQVTIIPPSSTYQLYIQPESLGLHQGDTNTASIAIQTQNPFSGTINLTASIHPLLATGPQISVNPSSVPVNFPAGYTGISWIFISINSTTATGQYEIDVRATSGGVTQTASFCLVVVPHGAAKFCMLSDANRLVIGPGQTVTSAISLYKTLGLINNTYLGTVSFSASVVQGPSPNAITATLNPAVFSLPYSLPGPQKLRSYLTVTASPNALPGNYIVRVSATNGTLTGSVDIPLAIQAGPVTGIPELFPGDWAQYQISTSWASTPPGLPPVPQVAQTLNAYSATLRVAATIGNETAALLSTDYLNGTQNVQLATGNTETGSPFLFPLIVGSNLKFNKTATQDFAGAPRVVSILNLTATGNGVTATGVWTWDYQKGILLEYQLTIHGTGSLGTISGLVHVRIIDTNLWTPTQPYFTLRPSAPFLTIQEYIATSSKIRVTSLNSFSGTVTLTAQPTPANRSIISISINSTLNLQSAQTSNATLTINTGPGHFIILVNATSGQQTHLATLGVTIINATPPTVNIAVGPNPASTGEPVTLNIAIHSILAPLTLMIDWGDGTFTNPDLTATRVTHVYTTAEFSPSHTYMISVNVTSLAGQGLATVSEIVNDRAPTLTITDLSPSPASTGQTVTLNFSVTDPDGLIESTWINWGDGSTPDLILNMTSGSMCQRLNPSINSNACTLALGDLLFSQPQDPGTIVNGSIIIFRPYAAELNFLVAHRVVKIIRSSTSIYNQITFWTMGDANPVIDAWDQPNSGIPASQVVAVYQHTLPPPGAPFARYDTHTYSSIANSESEAFAIRVNATDDAGLSISQTTSETIVDRPPVLSMNMHSLTSATIGQTVTVSISTTDPDGTISSVTVNWGDGTSPDILPASAISAAHSYMRAGSFTITITSTDNSGSTSHVSSLPVTITAPSTPASFLGLAPIEFYILVGTMAGVVSTAALLVFRRATKT